MTLSVLWLATRRNRDKVLAQNTVTRLAKGVRRRRNHWMFSDWNRVALEDRQTVAVFPRLGLVYNRIKKSGNTSITAFLSDLENPKQRLSSARAYKSIAPHLLDLPLVDAIRTRHFPIVTFVRNPYARVLSAFRDKVGSARNEVHRLVPGFGQDDEEGFLLFLQYLSENGLYENRHWWPQSDLIICPIEKFQVIGRLENVVEDMAKVLMLIERDPALAQSLSKRHPVSKNTTKSHQRLGQFYNNSTARSLVKVMYSRDFNLFGYDQDQIE